jgi:hypothetical protein
VFAATSLVSATALADGGANFGKSGQLVITWDQALTSTYAYGSSGPLPSVTNVGSPGSASMLDFEYVGVSNNYGSFTHFGIAPSAHFFVTDNLSVGGQLVLGIGSYSPSQGPGTSVTNVGIAPEIGYNIGINDMFSFWPKLFFGYQNEALSNNGGSYSQAVLGVYAPFLFHVAPHFFLGIGPNLSTQLVSTQANGPDLPKATVFGIMATFGGYFLGT